MTPLVYASSDNYPVAILIKSAAFNKAEIEANYIVPLEAKGIKREDIIVCPLAYNDKGKAPAGFIKETLAKLLPALASVSVKYIYCADAAYFKVLAGQRKAEPHLGYILKCAIKDYERMDVLLGVNHKSLLHNPINEPKLILSVSTLADVLTGSFQGLGTDIIKKASYPSGYEAIKTALASLHQYPDLVCDTETFSLDHDKAGLGTITFCWSKHEGMAFACDYAPLATPKDGMYGTYVRNDAIRELIREFLEAYQGSLTFHGSTFDIKILIAALWMQDLLDTVGLLTGLEVLTRTFHDTRIIAYLALNSAGADKGYLSLKQLAHLFAGNWAQDDIKDIRRIPLPKLLEYNLIDGLATHWVKETYWPRMVADQQEELYYKIMLPSQKLITQMELTGMPLNKQQVLRAKRKLTAIQREQDEIIFESPTVKKFILRLQHDKMVTANAKLKIKQHPIEHFADTTFNPGSDDQLRKLLYEEMGLPVLNRTKTKLPSADGDTLKMLVNHTTDPEYIAIITALQMRAEAMTILDTFIPAFLRAIDKGDGVVWLHGNFNLGGTVSGRLSSSDPNLQNLPATSTYAKLIKDCFQAPKGWLMLGADFNSLEDYISALTTRDPNKMKVYLDGYDGHCLRAFSYFPEKLPGIVDTVASINSIANVFPEVRQDSKGPTFALTYQGTWRTLMKKLGFPEDRAKAIEAGFLDLYKVSIQWVQDKLDKAGNDGYVTLAFGLRLRTPLLGKTIRGHRTTPYEAEKEGRTAGNALGQSYSLLNNRAANEFWGKVWNSPFRYDIKPIALIHDAIYPLVRDDYDVVTWVNRELIKSMQWQELPEIQHDTVKLGAELSVFWPSWKYELKLPNDATTQQIRDLCKEFKDQMVIGDKAA
jgi:DNA polymerase I